MTVPCFAEFSPCALCLERLHTETTEMLGALCVNVFKHGGHRGAIIGLNQWLTL
jgi:hypothetical protein